jgi:hypothetical protein
MVGDFVQKNVQIPFDHLLAHRAVKVALPADEAKEDLVCRRHGFLGALSNRAGPLKQAEDLGRLRGKVETFCNGKGIKEIRCFTKDVQTRIVCDFGHRQVFRIYLVLPPRVQDNDIVFSLHFFPLPIEIIIFGEKNTH